MICYILTIYNILPAEPDQYGYLARTDLKGDVVSQAPWLVFPYPGKIEDVHKNYFGDSTRFLF